VHRLVLADVPCAAAVLYTFGNIVSLFSTAFLFGPLRQLKNMFQLKRITATLLYIAALIGTLVVAFVVRRLAWVLGSACWRPACDPPASCMCDRSASGCCDRPRCGAIRL
jgi:hypothetical protein